MTDKRDSSAVAPAGKRRAPRKRPESEVDRAGLAQAVSDRLAELGRHGGNRAEVARRAQCSVSTLRNMEKGTGTSHYGHELLERVAGALGLPEDRRPADWLVKIFYLPLPRDPASLTEAEVTAEQVMNRLEPYLTKINAIPDMQKDFEGLQERLKGMADDVQEVKSRLKILVDINYQPPAG